jgi:hypothetical protein
MMSVKHLHRRITTEKVERIFVKYCEGKAMAIEIRIATKDMTVVQPSLRDLNCFSDGPGNELPGYFRFVPSGRVCGRTPRRGVPTLKFERRWLD